MTTRTELVDALSRIDLADATSGGVRVRVEEAAALIHQHIENTVTGHHSEQEKTMKSIHEMTAAESWAAINAWHENPWRCPVACGDTRTLVWYPDLPERAYMSCECRRWWPAPDGAVALAKQELSEPVFREHTVPVPVAGLRRTRVRVALNDSTVSITTTANRSTAA